MASHDLQIFLTNDQSPTLISTTAENYQEKMHHSGGAWSETLYIYLPAMKMAAQESSMDVLSVGLGLGYNEIIASAVHLKTASAKSVKIISFETIQKLKDEFQGFFFDHTNLDFSNCYSWILKHTALEFGLDETKLKDHIRNLLAQGNLQLRGPFPGDLQPLDQFNCILYDAFSNKMNPELWGEDFLKNHIGQIAKPSCVLSTYAATGNMKRAMKALGFQKIERSGFSGKRDSGFYTRLLDFRD